MLVFDPLAVLLLIAGNISLRRKDIEIEDGTITKVNIPPVQEKNESVEIQKENLATIETPVVDETPSQGSGDTIEAEEKIEPIQIPAPVDPFTGEVQKSPPPRIEHHAPGVYSEHHDTYDYDAELSFKEKEQKQSLNGGNF